MYENRFSPSKMVIPRTWTRTHEYRPQGEWDRVAEPMMVEFSESGHPVFRSMSPLSRGRSKAKLVENCQYTSVPMGIRLKLFLEQIFLLIRSVDTEVSELCEEYKACHVRTGRLCWQNSLTIVWASKFVDGNTYTFERRSCTRSLAKVPRTSGKALKTKFCDSNFVLMQDSWQKLKSDSISWRKTLKSSQNSQIQWHVASALCEEMTNQLTRKVRSEGVPKLGPC